MIDKTGFPSDTADKVLVRMPDGMRDQLKDAAKTNNRTMNAEIVARLQSTFAATSNASMAPMSGGGGDRAAMTPAQRDLSERLDKMEKDLELLVAGVKGGSFGKASVAEETRPKKKPAC